MPKITALPPAAAITTDDLLPIVDSPGGVPVTQKATFAQLVTLLNTIYAPITGGLYVLKTGDTMTGALAVDRSAIITTSTDGVVLQNLTAATAGVPVQNSPRLRLRSNVWNTTAVAATNTNDWVIESMPVSAATPSGQFRFGSSLNGGAIAYVAVLTSAGGLSLSGGLTTASTISTAAGSLIGFTGRGFLAAASDGVFTLFNAALTDFSRLQFGGTTSAFPALKRSTTTLQARLADDSAFANFSVLNVLSNLAASFITSSVALTDSAAASLGTLTNAPAAGNPTKWIGINDNGTIRQIPCW